ncbi:integrin alpha-M-like isoform X2 [Micropterus salmoides]|uniref:integrin alpha-M-like isoform X2 n=1 Tax=Micropterus salmoides TaxID=27706 RepID=UPI0018EA3661|nr:integrin alpha-M-like isoform X2 [Micropterus salmoides]
MEKMHVKHHFVWLTYTVAVATSVSFTFNIDTTTPHIYTTEQNDFFGKKVLQIISGKNNGRAVTAPQQLNGFEETCKRDLNQTHRCLVIPEISLTNKILPIKHFGLSIAEDATLSLYTVCSPSAIHECNENSHLNILDPLQQISCYTPGVRECTKKTVDLVFLFDGSGSMTEAEFNKNKDFIEDVMNSLTNTSVKFAAVQFSFDYRMVFDFSHFKAGRALDKLKKEPHMKSLTNTHKALRFVLEEIFDNPGAGASPDATKVLVLITDGDPSDTDAYGIIKRYNEKHIIRFVIAVKAAKLDHFKDIASDPTDKYTFRIENYNELTGILENFHKIIIMEGTKVVRAQEMTDEMSQSRFSAVFHKDTLMLGSVGTNSWRGSLHERKPTQTEVPHVQKDSYMGYSIAVGQKNNAPLYFTGAPTFEHTGQVVLFRQDCNNWTAAQRINGDQAGSHFGAELCSVDVNSDGNTDFLLVGAPLFNQPQEKTQGQIYVYTLTDEMELRSELNVTAPSSGRFGTTISSLADLNGDGLRDVAVGAPLEDDDRGAVYVYLGDGRRGIRSHFSQRILGQKIKPGMRFFGQAIDGDVGPGEDGLPNIVVGSQDMAVVLRSRPVFSVLARLSFHPEKISTETTDCLGNTEENRVLPMVTLTACFELVETTKSKAGAVNSGLNISCALSVDPMRQTHRAFFSPTDWTARNLTSTLKLRDKDTCFNYSVYRPQCVDDTSSPVSIRLNFFQADSERARAVLDVDSKRQAVAEVPFQK